jgi:hypothetical protein
LNKLHIISFCIWGYHMPSHVIAYLPNPQDSPRKAHYLARKVISRKEVNSAKINIPDTQKHLVNAQRTQPRWWLLETGALFAYKQRPQSVHFAQSTPLGDPQASNGSKAFNMCTCQQQ